MHLRPRRKLHRQRKQRDHVHQFIKRSYTGSRNRRYMIHVPAGYTGRREVPLVMVLHGCHQTHLEIRKISGFDAIADRKGFIVVYPYITSYSGLRSKNCWGWWFRNEIKPGQGEVEDLWQIVEEVKGLYRIDSRRIHVTGLSAGGGMAVAMMVAHADRIASGAVVAGAAYSETARAVGFFRYNKGTFKSVTKIARAMDDAMGSRKRPVPIMVVHSHDDATVNIRAAINIRDSWAECYQLDLKKQTDTNRGMSGKTHWEHIRYHDEHGQTLIETLFLSGPGHGWYGGAPGNYSYPEAPDISEMTWSFFKTHVHEVTARELSVRGQRMKLTTSKQVHSA
ncbi:MAG: PHB depolymerase family esterase [Candidatus Thiodiazotropha sp.]